MNEQPTHLDLFSGIGGFALAARWAGFRTVGFCEIEPYCQAVLKKHWPDVPCHKDIREVRGDLYAGVTLLTGGFPCQPFSYCGKRRGKNDHRNLWPEMLRIIKEQRPAWVIGENVAGIVNMELDQVHSDLEAEGYSVQTLLIPACAVGAIHRRNRAWIIANNNNIGMERGGEAKIFGVKKIQRNKNGGGFKELCGMPPISTPRIFRACDGVPGWVDRLKGLGNAIVPQVAYQIIKGIKEVMELNDEN